MKQQPTYRDPRELSSTSPGMLVSGMLPPWSGSLHLLLLTFPFDRTEGVHFPLSRPKMVEKGGIGWDEARLRNVADEHKKARDSSS